MTQIFTCSYRAYRSDMGQAVVTSLGLPRWRPEARQWPRCWLLTPTAELLAEDNEAFTAGYLARLERFGAQKISRTLERIAQENQAEALVLLCHESDAARCHRSIAAEWIIRTTGEAIDELT